MPWAQFDDHFHDSEGALAAGVEACGLHLQASCWSAAHLTDGRVSAAIVARLIASCRDGNGDELVSRLIAADLWQRDETGYVLIDFLTTNGNRTRATVEADRARKAKAGSKGGRVKAARDRKARATEPEPPPSRDDDFGGL
jgi:hypothetical protein